MAQIRTAITEVALDVSAAIAEVATPECGGIATFVGTVRESAAAPGRKEAVEALEYECHPKLAPARLDAVAAAASERWDVRRLVIEHRSGLCKTGDPTVVIACSAPHRADALEACCWMIDEIKREVPIWKREIYVDGSSWVGAGS